MNIMAWVFGILNVMQFVGGVIIMLLYGWYREQKAKGGLFGEAVQVHDYTPVLTGGQPNTWYAEKFGDGSIKKYAGDGAVTVLRQPDSVIGGSPEETPPLDAEDVIHKTGYKFAVICPKGLEMYWGVNINDTKDVVIRRLLETLSFLRDQLEEETFDKQALIGEIAKLTEKFSQAVTFPDKKSRSNKK